MTYELEMIKLYDHLQMPSVYKNVKNEMKRVPLLPLRCVFVNVDIEISIDMEGNFLGAVPVLYKDSLTITPATENSASRSSDASHHLAFDNLKYVAGDLLKYFDPNSKKKESDSNNNSKEKIIEKHQEYLNLLQETSSHKKALDAIKVTYRYVKREH